MLRVAEHAEVWREKWDWRIKHNKKVGDGKKDAGQVNDSLLSA